MQIEIKKNEMFVFFMFTLRRITFYFAWTLADLICNMSGLGFNGFDELNRPKWDLLTNVNITQIEVFKKKFLYIVRKKKSSNQYI